MVKRVYLVQVSRHKDDYEMEKAMIDLDKIEARAKAASPGPWVAFDNDGYSIWRVQAGERLIAEVVGDSAETDANAAFIGAARQDIPALIAEVRALRNIVREVRESSLKCLSPECEARYIRCVNCRIEKALRDYDEGRR